MKHTLRTIIWVIAMTLGVCASAQTDTKRAFRMYMHDGSVQFFFYSDIQSMTVGYEDGDMERPVQIINTPDSVYTFAMADIDSVSFARPVTEYKSNVVRLEDGLRSYLTASDSLKLTFRSDVPRNLFPTVGGYLVTLECDELLPGGFIGKLASVREEGGVVVALCEMAAVTDVFEKLFISTGDNVNSAKNASQHSKKKANYYNGDIEISPIQNEKVLDDYDYEKGNFQGNYNCKVGYEVSTQKFHVNAFLLIENGYVTYSITTNGEHNLNLNGSVAFSYDYKRRFPIICKSIRIPGFPFFSVKPEFGLYVESNGEIAFEHNSDFPFKTVIHNEFNSRMLSVLENRIPNGAKIVWGEPKHSNSVEGNATVGFGVYGALNLVAGVEEIANIKAGIETGLSFSGKAYKEIGGNSIETPDTKMYDNNNDDEALKCDFAFSGFVEFSSKLFDCLNHKYNYDFSGYIINNPIWARGIVPEFFDVSLSKSDVAGSLTASAALRRKLAFNANVGLGLYDSNDKLVDSWWCDVKYKDQENTQITHDFSNLKAGEKYTLHPLVHALNDNMVANPSAKNKVEDYGEDIEFSVAYPSYYWYYNPDDCIDFEIAIKPNIPETESKSIIAYGPVIYKDNKIVVSRFQDCNEQNPVLTEGWVKTGCNINRNELQIDNSNYIAKAPESYKVGVQFKKITELGDTIITVSKYVKQIEWIYNEKPWIQIYRADIRCTDGCVYDTSMKPDDPLRFGLSYDIYYMCGGGFWMKENYKVPDYICVSITFDDYSFESASGYSYSLTNIPLGLCICGLDVNGEIIRSNPIEFEHSSSGKVIDDWYEIEPEDKRSPYNYWYPIYNNNW